MRNDSAQCVPYFKGQSTHKVPKGEDTVASPPHSFPVVQINGSQTWACIRIPRSAC